MLVRDEALQGRHEKQKVIQKTRQIAFDAGKAENRGHALVRDKHESAANVERQEGKRLTGTQFITKLKTINPDFPWTHIQAYRPRMSR